MKQYASQNITKTTTVHMHTRYITNIRNLIWRPFWISKWCSSHIDCNVNGWYEAVYTTYSQNITKNARISHIFLYFYYICRCR
jgi:hypothetical protein